MRGLLGKDPPEHLHGFAPLEETAIGIAELVREQARAVRRPSRR